MPNIALNKIADASNSVYPFQPSKAVDGVLSPLNRWVGSSPLPPEPATPAPVWLRVDLGAFYWINRWVVKQMGAIGWPVAGTPGGANYNLTDYKLQGSLDNANWFDIDSVTNNSANQTDRTCAPTKVRWARIYVTKGLRCNTNFASIADLELYNADPTSAQLTALTLSSGTITPSFGANAYAYSANVGYDTASVTVTATVQDSRATIKVNGVPAVSGQPSAPVSLSPGAVTPITVEVTPYIGNPQNYVINVTRASSPYLTGFVITSGRTTLTLNPTFSKNTLVYTSAVGNTTSVNVTATTEVNSSTLTINSSPATSGVASAVAVSSGSNSIMVRVSSGTGTDSKEYQCVLTVG